MARGPIDQLREGRPIGFLRQVGGLGLRAGHDQAVELGFAEISRIPIGSAQIEAGALAARNARQREEAQANPARAGRGPEQLQELLLGCLERRLRHVVDEPDLDPFAAGRMPARLQPLRSAVLACHDAAATRTSVDQDGHAGSQTYSAAIALWRSAVVAASA